MTDLPSTAFDRHWRFSIAPMLDWTDRYCRYFHRLMTRQTRLYTEMVTTGAIIHGPRHRLLAFNAAEHPLAVQLGGNDPDELARCARICADYGYDEINLNIGCPSDRVQNGAFGACLMHVPQTVAAGVAAMRAAVDLPVTVKCRIGVDDQEPREALFAMAEAVYRAGAAGLIVHARKAWLKGLSPKENRNIPPLDYPLVHELKRHYRHWPIAINGGIADLDETERQLQHVDGVMMGRAAYHHPMLLLDIDRRLFGADNPLPDDFAALEAYLPFIERQLASAVPLHAMTRHLLGLFAGRPGARLFRRHLAMEGVKRSAGVEVVRQAMTFVSPPLPGEPTEV